MKTLILTILSFSLLLAESGRLYGQVTQLDNNPSGGAYLGWNGAQNLEFRTNNLTRMQQMQTGNSTINGFSVPRGGFLGLSQDPTFFTTGAQSPYSLLHLNGNNPSGAPQQAGYYDWMRYGISFTHNQDFMYVGQRAIGPDITDAVIQWADNPSGPGVGPDNLTFLFNQLECARMIGQGHTGIGTLWNNDSQPKRTLDVIRNDGASQFRISYSSALGLTVTGGIHTDFQTSSSGNMHIKPTSGGNLRAVAIGFLNGEQPNPTTATRLDVGGLTRIRDLAENTPRTLIIGYATLANLGTPADNFMGRLDFPNDPNVYLAGNGTFQPVTATGGADLDWEFNTNDVWTGHGLNGYPGGTVTVGGIPGNNAKFTVLETANNPNRAGILTRVTTTPTATGTIRGIDSEIDGPFGNQIIAVNGLARDGKLAIGGRFTSILDNDQSVWCAGVAGYSFGSAESDHDVIGVYGYADNSAPQQTPIGVYGEAISNGSIAGTLAGHFAGNIQILLPPIVLSDESVKSNINELEGVNEILMALNPVNYNYNFEETFGFSSGEQLSHGFLAQEVQDVFSSAIAPFHHPAKYDTSGTLVREAVDLLGIRYNEFIPLLVAGYQGQQGSIEAQLNASEAQASVISNLELVVSAQATQLAEQAAVISELQTQMNSVLASVQAMHAKTNNCCNQQSGGEQGSVMPLDGEAPMKLAQNVPNPFSEATRIDFELPRAAQVIMEISDAQGRPIEKLIDGQMADGMHSIQWDGSRLAPGMYFYSLYANGELLTKKMIKK